MKQLICLVILITTATLYALTGVVTTVKDGDTLVLLSVNIETVIRLYGIDCPEKDQESGNNAKQYCSSLVLGKTVNVTVMSKDVYGRTIGQVFLANGDCLNYKLVQSGWAWHSAKYSTDGNLSIYQTVAKARKIGLWKDSNPIPPWEWRKSHK